MKKQAKAREAKPTSGKAREAKAVTGMFVGAYSYDFCNVFLGAVLANQHALMLGDPGNGKTRMSRAAMKQLNPEAAKNIFIRYDPSMPPEALQGMYDPIAMLGTKDIPPQLVRLTEGTPYAPGVRMVVLDELYRGNDPAFDITLDITDRIDDDDEGQLSAPTVIGTANFVVVSDRVSALNDRFLFWFWFPSISINVPALVKANLSTRGGLTLDYAFPTWDAIMKIRQSVITPRAMDAVANVIGMLNDEAIRAGLMPHQRRLAQWAKMLARVGTYYADTNDFASVPAEANMLLRYAWPAETAAAAATWQAIAAKIVDPMGSIIEVVKAEALKLFKEISALNATERSSRMGQMSAFLSGTEARLMNVSSTDPRVEATIELLTEWMGSATLGVAPSAS